MSIPSFFDPLRAFILPREAAKLKERFWTPNQASKAWGCSRSTAYRLIDRFEKELHAELIWVVRPGKTEIWRVIPANSVRPELPKGNPAFRDKQYQSCTARAREAKRRSAQR